MRPKSVGRSLASSSGTGGSSGSSPNVTPHRLGRTEPTWSLSEWRRFVLVRLPREFAVLCYFRWGPCQSFGSSVARSVGRNAEQEAEYLLGVRATGGPE